MKKTIITLLFFLATQCFYSQTDKELITKTLNNYIEGTSNGEPEKIQKAFHKDLNLYAVSQDKLKITNGQRYITFFKKGQKNDRMGKIISIDVVNDAAVAKVHIFSPSRKRLYTDFMMLLRIKGDWKIIHKSYTSVQTNMKASEF